MYFMSLGWEKDKYHYGAKGVISSDIIEWVGREVDGEAIEIVRSCWTRVID